MQKYNSITFKNKRNKEYCIVESNETETSGKGQEYFNVVLTKNTDQPITKSLSDCRHRMEAHLMFASEFIDKSINLDENLDYEKYFKEMEHQKDERFNGVEVTKIVFISNKEGNLSGVQVIGKKITQHTDKPFTNPIKTPVINLNKESENYYKLVVILDSQVSDLISAIDDFLERGKRLKDSQLKIA